MKHVSTLTDTLKYAHAHLEILKRRSRTRYLRIHGWADDRTRGRGFLVKKTRRKERRRCK